MAESAYNNLQYLKELVEAGVPQAQAEVMAKAYVQNPQLLVTRDHLDTRFDGFEALIDSRLEAIEVRLDSRFEVFETRFDAKLDALEDRVNAKFRYFAFTQAILIGGVFLPLLKTWIS